MHTIDERLGEPYERITCNEGEARFWVVERRILVSQAISVATAAAARRLTEIGDDLIRQGLRIYLVNDWAAVDTFESACRTTLVAWGLRNLRHLNSASFIARSKVLKMSVQVASTAFPRGFHIFDDQASFVAAFEKLRVVLRERDRSAG
jgi:hypothetical protein